MIVIAFFCHLSIMAIASSVIHLTLFEAKTQNPRSMVYPGVSVICFADEATLVIQIPVKVHPQTMRMDAIVE